jgi:hypothetical protein
MASAADDEGIEIIEFTNAAHKEGTREGTRVADSESALADSSHHKLLATPLLLCCGDALSGTPTTSS